MKLNKVPKVLMISARADFGGGPEHIYTLAKGLQDRVSLYVACPQEFPYWDRFTSLLGDLRVVKIPHRKFTLKALWSLKYFVESNQIDIIHSHGKGAGIYGRLLGIITKKPCVYTYHGLHIAQYKAVTKLLYLFYEKALSYFTTLIIAVSHSESENLLANKVCSQNKIIVIPNGVVVPKDMSAVPLADHHFAIVSVTSYNTPKNPGLLKRIIMLLSETGYFHQIKFFILGKGEGYGDFCSFVAENKLDKMVEVVGATPTPCEYYSIASCYLSTSSWEGMPLAMMEAMSFGVPVVATSVVGNVDVVSHGADGYLYAIDKPEEAVKYIISFIKDRDLLRRMSISAREKAILNFSSERMTSDTLLCYQKILNEKNSLV